MHDWREENLKRNNVRVSPEEVQKQKIFIQYIRELHENKPKKYLIDTFGCQMNEHDSEKLAGMLGEMGYTLAASQEESDFILLNTCCVRENAEQKVYGHLGALKKYKTERPDMVIGICGCMMQQNQVVETVKKKYRQVGLIFGTHNLYKFPELLYETMTRGKRSVEVWEHEGAIAEDIPITRRDGLKAYVNVMYGCNNFCSYCIVPYVRGRERSRLPEDIIKEVKDLVSEGFKEVTLLGQNVNSYGLDFDSGISFAKLLGLVNEVDGIGRIRFTTSHPKDLSDELIYAVRDLDKVCKHIHLPFQSGSTKILKDMNRKYTKEYYIALVDRIKENIPDVGLTTDIIVGYPGETEVDFQDTLDVVKHVKFDQSFTFLYSKRTGTPAATREDQVLPEERRERFQRLLDLQEIISLELNETYAEKTVKVLVEGPSKNKAEYLTGRTDSNKIVNFIGDEDLIGKFIDLSVKTVSTWWLEGEIK